MRGGAETRSLAACLALVALVPVLSTNALAESFDQSFSFSGDRLFLANLVGTLTVEKHGGSGYEVIVRVDGADASREGVTFEKTDEGLVIRYPGDERKFSYPEMRRRSRVTFSYDPRREVGDSVVGKIFRRGRGHRVTVSGSRGFEAWADVTVRMPRGGELEAMVGVGDLTATNIEGAVTLLSRYGHVRVDGIVGDVRLDTGHGDCDVRAVTGTCRVDTGNGDVDVSAITGRDLRIDSGNGRISLAEVRVETLEVDTGNGRIEAESITAKSARIDTGNGSIDLFFDEIGDGRFVLDTGNGSIDLRLPENASADVQADTGHGRVRLDVDDNLMDVRHRSRDNVRFTMGDGGARIRLDSGNGSIRIST